LQVFFLHSLFGVADIAQIDKKYVASVQLVSKVSIGHHMAVRPGEGKYPDKKSIPEYGLSRDR